MSSHKPSLCVVIPAYNEQQGIEQCVKAVLPVLKSLEISSQLLIVEDGSSDNTLKIIKRLQKKNRTHLRYVAHTQNQGYGAALSTGAEQARQDGFSHVLYMDSDLTNDPADIPRFAEYCSDPKVDCVKASRFIKGGKMEGVPLFRQVISKMGNFLASLAFRLGIRDCTNGFRMLRLNTIASLKLASRGFSSILEELVFLKKHKARCIEIPVTLTSRTQTASHFVYSPTVFWEYFRYVLQALVA